MMVVSEVIVPCNGCRACCRDNFVPIDESNGDVLADYKTRFATLSPIAESFPILDHKPNGECIYLGDTGCTIWNRRPYMCRIYDCRAQFLSMTRAERRRNIKLGILKPAIFEAAKARLDTLTDEQRRTAIAMRGTENHVA